jgi:RNA polymerase subunit RPABC4/transcription elongation factor Spt4
MMTDSNSRRDARHCPVCGARGILPFDQPAAPDGSIENPTMICPVCEVEFLAVGMRWVGAFRPGRTT